MQNISADLLHCAPRFLFLILLFLLTIGGAIPSGAVSAFETNSRPEQALAQPDRFADIEQHAMQAGANQLSGAGNTSNYSLVVDNSGDVYSFQGGPLTLVGELANQQLRGVAWRPDGAYALIVGQGSIIEKYDGAQFASIDPGISKNVNLQSVAWKPDGSYALIAGSQGTVLKYDGAFVTEIPGSDSGVTIRSISWHPDGSSALLAGDDGEVLVFQNGSLLPLDSGTDSDLYAVSYNPTGDCVLLSGTNGTILKYDGASFTAFFTSGLYNSTHIVRSIGWNSTGSLALLVGDTGLALSFNQTTLSRLEFNGLPNLTEHNLYGVAWSAGSATIIGGSGTVFRFTGTLEELDSGVSSSLRGIGWAPPFRADFTSIPTVPIGGTPVNFTATASGSPPYAFNWNLGDNTSDTANPLTHTYTLTGNLTVTLTVTDVKGLVSTVMRTVTVLPWPTSFFRLDWADYDNTGHVDIVDLSHAALCYDRTSASTDWQSCSYWDFNLNNKIELFDLAQAVIYYDRTMPSPFPGQGHQPGKMDQQWIQFLFLLDPLDRLYFESNQE